VPSHRYLQHVALRFVQVKLVVPDNDRFGTSVGYMIIANLALMFATYFTEYW
jgi:hypothetical protein